MSGGALTLHTWKTLVKLTAENVSDDKLMAILRDELDVHALEHLSESQAAELTRVLSTLPALRELLWQATVAAIQDEQQIADNRLSSIEAINLANLVVPKILDSLAHQFVRSNTDRSLFDNGPQNGAPLA